MTCYFYSLTGLTCTAIFTTSAQSATQLFNIPTVTHPWIFTAHTTSSAKKRGDFIQWLNLSALILWNAQVVNGILALPNNWRHTMRHHETPTALVVLPTQMLIISFTFQIIHFFIFLHFFLLLKKTHNFQTHPHFSLWSPSCYTATCWKEIREFIETTK